MFCQRSRLKIVASGNATNQELGEPFSAYPNGNMTLVRVGYSKLPSREALTLHPESISNQKA
jgi:hypothetical protein